MEKKPARSTRKRKNKSRDIPISDPGLGEFERSAKKTAETDPEVRERLPHILRYLAMIREHIRENDARRAVYATIFLCQQLYESGLNKPFAPGLKARMALIKAGKKSAESRAEKFDWYAIQEEANEIWRRHRSYSKLRVARIIQERFEERGEPDILKIDTIRKKINKPT